MALWEEEQSRSSSICKANSYDKRIATSERSYEGIGVCGGLGGKPRQMFEGTKNIPHTQVNYKKNIYQQIYN